MRRDQRAGNGQPVSQLESQNCTVTPSRWRASCWAHPAVATCLDREFCTPIRVLLVEDSEDDTALILRALRRGGYAPIHQRVDTRGAMEAALASQSWDIVTCDYHMPGFSLLGAWQVLQQSGRGLPFVIVSGIINATVLLTATETGARACIGKNELSRLLGLLAEMRAAEQQAAREA